MRDKSATLLTTAPAKKGSEVLPGLYTSPEGRFVHPLDLQTAKIVHK